MDRVRALIGIKSHNNNNSFNTNNNRDIRSNINRNLEYTGSTPTTRIVNENIGSRDEIARGDGDRRFIRQPLNGTDQFSLYDQHTVVENEGNNPIEESMTINNDDIHTFISESQTIGDLYTRGYVNRSPNFDSVRNIPLVSILLTRGLFAFSSDISYKTFLNNKRKLDQPASLDNGGIGVPLFHAVTNNVIKSLLVSGKSKVEPVMKIFKYQIIDNNHTSSLEDLELLPNYEIILQNNISNKFLIKYEFCQIFKSIDENNSLKIIHILKFHDGKEIRMVNFSDKKDIDTVVDDFPLRWYGFSGFASPFGSNDIKLLVLDDNMPSYMDNNTINSGVNNSHTNNANQLISSRPLRALPIWGRYSDTNVSMLPTKRTVKLANFKIKELSQATNAALYTDSDEDSTSLSNGITMIPENTQILTCMCMLLHEYESRKERRHKNNTANDDSILFTNN
ncbi:uncharacterized protein PWA37_003304 [Arxiozyma heterogenica]|uniref:Uncharacterized protein n=1 Tax=Arxiozyma heterogenica TaxID=278026 RepID=A0AAN7WPL9_9SACH|nr:hypothetical protein RI543_001779 [Kazachstania heterogenica]